MTILEVENLSKNFKELIAVDDLSFSVPKGEIYGFLGQNGAGKSTTIRMLLTLVHPNSGSIRFFGKELNTNRRSILKNVGAIIEKPDLYKYLTAVQNLKIMARLNGMHISREKLLERLAQVGLDDRADSKIKTFSQGMKQRLGIACALINDPQLVILDEPVNGLDPHGIADMRNLILHLSKNEGKTIVISSHLLPEIELIADSMLIIDKGKKIAEGTVAELLNPTGMLVEIKTTDDTFTKREIQNSQWSGFLENTETILLKMDKNSIPELNKYLVQAGVNVLSIQPKHSLENYFLSLTSSNRHVATYKN